MEMSRNQQQFIVMTVIYDELVDQTYGKGDSFPDVNEVIELLCECPIAEVDPYIIRSVALSIQNYGKIVKAYEPLLHNWTWDRIPLLTKAILIMSYAHYFFVEEIDKKIVINIAVELSKKYVDDKQGKFVNGILDNALRK